MALENDLKTFNSYRSCSLKTGCGLLLRNKKSPDKWIHCVLRISTLMKKYRSKNKQTSGYDNFTFLKVQFLSCATSAFMNPWFTTPDGNSILIVVTIYSKCSFQLLGNSIRGRHVRAKIPIENDRHKKRKSTNDYDKHASSLCGFLSPKLENSSVFWKPDLFSVF